jgi:hypothetical protein
MDDILKNFNSILEKIISFSIKINEIIKDLENDADKINIDIIENIDNIYKERGVLVEELKLIFDNCENKESLLKENLLLIKYNTEISPLEAQNMEFLNKKSTETKHKLTELSNNKSLLIYNQKVELSYENKFI